MAFSASPHDRRQSSPNPGEENAGRTDDFLTSQDAVRLLKIMGAVAAVRDNPRAWRLEILNQLNILLGAAGSAALILKDVGVEPAQGHQPTAVSIVDAGFPSEIQRQAFLREYDTFPIQEPALLAALEKLRAEKLDTLTANRSDLLHGDSGRKNSPISATSEENPRVHDGLISLHRGGQRGRAYALFVFPALPGQKEAEGPDADAVSAEGFEERGRALLDTLHRGLAWIYRLEEATHKADPAAALAPRLRQALDYLLAGKTERQAAEKMAISVHTVHDYVKVIYSHFHVSSRSELLAKWMRTGGHLPSRKD